VLLHLHGAGQGGEDGLRQTNWALGDQIRWHAEQFPMIVVFPQAREKFQWFGEMGTMAMKAVQTSIKEFQGDEERIYLMGGSRSSGEPKSCVCFCKIYNIALSLNRL
jgi:predicted peptidase